LVLFAISGFLISGVSLFVVSRASSSNKKKKELWCVFPVGSNFFPKVFVFFFFEEGERNFVTFIFS